MLFSILLSSGVSVAFDTPPPLRSSTDSLKYEDDDDDDNTTAADDNKNCSSKGIVLAKTVYNLKAKNPTETRLATWHQEDVEENSPSQPEAAGNISRVISNLSTKMASK